MFFFWFFVVKCDLEIASATRSCIQKIKMTVRLCDCSCDFEVMWYEISWWNPLTPVIILNLYWIRFLWNEACWLETSFIIPKSISALQVVPFKINRHPLRCQIQTWTITVHGNWDKCVMCPCNVGQLDTRIWRMLELPADGC